MRAWRWALIGAAVFTTGCLEVAAERARMDASVGRAQNGGDTVK